MQREVGGRSFPCTGGTEHLAAPSRAQHAALEALTGAGSTWAAGREFVLLRVDLGVLLEVSGCEKMFVPGPTENTFLGVEIRFILERIEHPSLQ